MDNWKKLLVGGVAIGVLLMLAQHAFKIDSKVFQMAVLILSIVAFVVYAIFNKQSNASEGKRVQAQRELMQQGRTQEALQDMQAMAEELDQKGKKEAAARCRLNMTAAYHNLEQYDKELEILEGFQGDEFKGLAKVVYQLNLCASYFYLDQDEKGLQVYEANRAIFTDYNQHKRYGGTIAAVLMFSKIAQGKCDQAQSLLTDARIAWPDRNFQQDYDLVEQKLAKVGQDSSVRCMEAGTEA